MLTQHNDALRTGQNLNEAVLTPANVKSSTFGKLFSLSVDGAVYAQPLYIQNVNISGKGMHNVLLIATEHDSVYAFDADDTSGINADPLWRVSFLDSGHGAAGGATTIPNGMVSTADINPEIGITGTPVIDAGTNTVYVVGKTLEGGKAVQRLHALDLGSGSEKFNGPVTIQASVNGNGSGSTGGVLRFDPLWEHNRPGLLLLKGTLFLGFAAHGDNGPWHGWVLSYNPSTLAQISAFCTTPNGIGSGFWMSGAGLAGDTSDPNFPGGRLFVATGNGSFNANNPPYTNSMNYGDDVIRLNVTNGALGVSDTFTPGDQASLSSSDTDLGSGGVLLLPDQGGTFKHVLVQVGKSGDIFLINRDSMGGFNSNNDNVIEKVTGETSGLWSIPTYWNGNIYLIGNSDHIKAFSVSGSGISNTPLFQSAEKFGYPGAMPSISANGGSDGIVWTLQVAAYSSNGPSVLEAHDATNLTTLYRSDQNSTETPPPVWQSSSPHRLSRMAKYMWERPGR